MPTHSPEPHRSRRSAIAAALEVAAAAEGAALGPGEGGATATYEASASTAWLPSEQRSLQALGLPDPALGAPRAVSWTLESGARSAFVRLGKYATPRTVKLRTYVRYGERWLSLKVWGSAPEVAGRALRERQARQAVAPIVAYAAPPLLVAGADANFSYLLEEAISGTHPVTRVERTRAAVALGRSLLAAYQVSGVEWCRLSEVVRPEFADGFGVLVEDRGLPWPRTGGAARALRRLRRLVASDRLLPCALGHGDLNSDNVVLDPQGRYWLVDWENGGVRPVAFDLRRLFRDSKDPWEVQRSLAVDLRPFDRPARRVYRWNEQLALAMCNELVLTPLRRERAREHGEVILFDAVLADSLGWLVELLE